MSTVSYQSSKNSSRPLSSLNYGGTNAQSKQKSRIQSAYGSSAKSKKTNNIPLSDLMRIREKIGLDENQEGHTEQRQKLELYEKSQQRVKHWPNTLSGLRKKKDSQRFERFKEDELERRRIDEEEKEYQAAEKRTVLDKANKQIYDRDDRVKEFQSKIGLVEMLDERKQQIGLKKYVKEIKDKREQIYVDQQADYLRREDEKEKIKLEILKKKRAQTAKVLRDQHEEQKLRYIEHMQNQKIEGEIIKVRALELLEKEKQEEVKRRERALQLQQEIREGNEDLKVIRRHLKEKEKEEDKIIKQHADKIEKIADMKKKRQEYIFQEKQNERQKLIDKQTKQLKEIKDKEDKRVNKEIKEAEIKAEQNELIKKQKRAELVKNIDKSIKQNLERKRVQSAVEKQEDQDYKQYWVRKNEQIHAREAQEKIEQIQRCKELEDFRRLQAEEKQRQREQRVYQELEEEESIRKIQENDKKNFNSWAARMIETQKQDGKEIGPLLTTLKNLNAQY